MNSASAAQLTELMQYMSDQIRIPTVGIGGGYNPIGTIITYMGTNAPLDYIECDGSIYNIANYEQLASYFAAQYGASNYFGGDGTTTFGVPDLSSEAPTDGIMCIKSREENAYSTVEQRIGTWVDGKPLYQRTFTGTISGVVDKTVSSITAGTIPAIERAVNCWGYCYGNFISSGWVSNGNNYFIRGMMDGTSIKVQLNRDSLNNKPYWITLQYTKSTD